MRSVQNWISLVVVCLFGAVPLQAQQSSAGPAIPLIGVTSSTKNPLQVAILHWYNANQTASFAVFNPFGVAFDGANIWVTSFGSDNVAKLRASDGATLGTFAVGSLPDAVAFDGANIWVANELSNTVSKL